MCCRQRLLASRLRSEGVAGCRGCFVCTIRRRDNSSGSIVLPEVQVAPREYLTAAVPLCVLPYRLSWPSSARPVNRPEMCVLEVDERRHANHDVLGYPGRKAPEILGL